MEKIVIISLIFYTATQLVLSSDVESHSHKKEKIVGGIIAKKNEFAYVVALQSNDKTICSGSIIGKKFILTAAHCLVNEETGQFRDYSKFTVVAGSNRVEGPLMKNSPVKASITKVFIPKGYQPINPELNTLKSRKEIAADIAVIQLNENLWKIFKSRKISTLKLPKFNAQKQYDGEAKVIGFGAWAALPIFSFDKSYKFDFKIDGRLRHANIDILDEETCNKVLKSPPTNILVICGRIKPKADDEDGPLQRSTCHGDSGGPLVKGSTVIGVASFGSKYCDDKNHPSFYTKVSAYVPFIMNAMKNIKTNDMNVWPENRLSVSQV